MSSKLALRILISLIIAVVGGVLCNIIFKFKDGMGFIAGLLFFVLMELLFLLLELDETHSIKDAILSLSTILKLDDRFSYYYATLVLSSIRTKGRELIKDGIKIPKEEVARVWTECIAYMDVRLEVTTYVSPTAWWNKEYSDPNVELRKNKARQGKTVRTLFLWDSPDELPDLKKIADDQKAGGISVSHASLKSIIEDPILKPHLDRIETPDFGLIDGHWVFLHYLDENRKTKSAKLTHNTDVVKACHSFLELAKGEKDFTKVGKEA